MFIDLCIHFNTVLQQCHLLSYTVLKKTRENERCDNIVSVSECVCFSVIAAVSLIVKYGKIMQI